MDSKRTWAGKLGLGRMSANEYRANLNGLNMFFGAVLGLVLTGTEKMPEWQFGALLCMLAGIVITILFISSSRHRVAYALLALFYTLTLPWMTDFIFHAHDVLPDKIRPTLLAWTLMTILIEFWGREKEAPAQAAADAA